MNTDILADVLMQSPTTSVVAAAGTAAWFWVPALQATSSAAGLILPILSVIWIGLQIKAHLKDRKRKELERKLEEGTLTDLKKDD